MLLKISKKNIVFPFMFSIGLSFLVYVVLFIISISDDTFKLPYLAIPAISLSTLGVSGFLCTILYSSLVYFVENDENSIHLPIEKQKQYLMLFSFIAVVILCHSILQFILQTIITYILYPSEILMQSQLYTYVCFYIMCLFFASILLLFVSSAKRVNEAVSLVLYMFFFFYLVLIINEFINSTTLSVVGYNDLYEYDFINRLVDLIATPNYKVFDIFYLYLFIVTLVSVIFGSLLARTREDDYINTNSFNVKSPYTLVVSLRSVYVMSFTTFICFILLPFNYLTCFIFAVIALPFSILIQLIFGCRLNLKNIFFAIVIPLFCCSSIIAGYLSYLLNAEYPKYSNISEVLVSDSFIAPDSDDASYSDFVNNRLNLLIVRDNNDISNVMSKLIPTFNTYENVEVKTNNTKFYYYRHDNNVEDALIDYNKAVENTFEELSSDPNVRVIVMDDDNYGKKLEISQTKTLEFTNWISKLILSQSQLDTNNDANQSYLYHIEFETKNMNSDSLLKSKYVNILVPLSQEDLEILSSYLE